MRLTEATQGVISSLRDELLTQTRMENPFEAINQNFERLFYLIQQLSQQLNHKPDPDNPIDIKEAAIYLKISEGAIYKKIDKIPHCKRDGKLYFFKSKLREYIEAGARVDMQSLRANT